MQPKTLRTNSNYNQIHIIYTIDCSNSKQDLKRNTSWTTSFESTSRYSNCKTESTGKCSQNLRATLFVMTLCFLSHCTIQTHIGLELFSHHKWQKNGFRIVFGNIVHRRWPWHIHRSWLRMHSSEPRFPFQDKLFLVIDILSNTNCRARKIIRQVLICGPKIEPTWRHKIWGASWGNTE